MCFEDEALAEAMGSSALRWLARAGPGADEADVEEGVAVVADGQQVGGRVLPAS